MTYDPSDVSVRIEDYELPGIEEIDPDFGETVEPVSSVQGFVDHKIVYAPATCKLKFKAAPGNEAVHGLAEYFRSHTQVTVTIITPEYVATIVQARLHAYPKKSAGVGDFATYDVELSGKSAGPRYV